MTIKIDEIFKTSEQRSFEVTSGAIRVTDPCYGMGTWCAGTIDQAKNGRWVAHVGYTSDALDLKSFERSIVVSQRLIDVTEGRHDGKDMSDLDDWAQKRIAPHLPRLLQDLKLLEDSEKSKSGVDVAGIRRAMAEIYKLDLKEYRDAKANYSGRVAYLAAHHESVPMPDLLDLSGWEETSVDVGVDSGQAGLFDLTRYAAALGIGDHNHPIQEAEYDAVCKLTLGNDQWGALAYGAVSSSGLGDGGYNLLLKRNEGGEAVAALIVYMTVESDEEDELTDAVLLSA